MDNELIIRLLHQNNRLIIPNFGTLLCKDNAAGHRYVFSPFLKRDDGVLRGAIEQEYSLDKADAQTMIEEFVQHIQNGIQKNGKYDIPEVGLLSLDANGAITLINSKLAQGKETEKETATPNVEVAEKPTEVTYTQKEPHTQQEPYTQQALEFMTRTSISSTLASQPQNSTQDAIKAPINEPTMGDEAQFGGPIGTTITQTVQRPASAMTGATTPQMPSSMPNSMSSSGLTSGTTSAPASGLTSGTASGTASWTASATASVPTATSTPKVMPSGIGSPSMHRPVVTPVQRPIPPMPQQHPTAQPMGTLRGGGMGTPPVIGAPGGHISGTPQQRPMNNPADREAYSPNSIPPTMQQRPMGSTMGGQRSTTPQQRAVPQGSAPHGSTPHSSSPHGSAPHNGARPQRNGGQPQGATAQKADLWLVAAIIVALVVIGIMVYGFWVSNPTIEIEPIIQDTTIIIDGGME